MSDSASRVLFPVVQRADAPGWLDSSAKPGAIKPVSFSRAGAATNPLTPADRVTPAAIPTLERTPRSASAPPVAPVPISADAAEILQEQLRAAAAAELEAQMDAVSAEIEAEREELERTREGLDAVRRALEEEREELEAAKKQFAEAEEELATAQSRALEDAKETMVELAVGIAEALLGRALEREPALMQNLARAAIETLGDAGGIELRASRESYDRLVEALGAPELSHGGAKVPVVLDESLDGTGFVAQAGRARVEGRIAPRLEAVREALRHELRAEGERSS